MGALLFGGDGGIPGATGAVPPPARGAEKPFTGWFFTSACSGRTLRIPPSLFLKYKRDTFGVPFVFGGDGGIRTHVEFPPN